jgi:prephenate dehydrogenase
VSGGGSVAVLGLGLMGGSLARDLAALGLPVLGYDRDPRTLAAALEEGVVAAPLDPSLAGLAAADLVFLALPVAAAPELLRRALPHLAPGCVLADLGSTKASIVREALRLGVGERFVGCHPLAGDHRAGWDASRPGLLRGARVFLCPTPLTAPAALERVERLWTALGAAPEIVDAGEHDRRLAWTSHLPQALSSALAGTLGRAGLPPAELGPGGRDVARLAASSPEMWTAICLDNAQAVTTALSALEASLARLRSALERGDAGAVEEFFRAGREWTEERGPESRE